ncbi:hypothetical protein [Robinsoniella peoriensis]|uniref:hypothetical protein n=1 Tax=Robinsoniella peoriensis TaxID=180332 RepID=UPI003624F752
MGVGNLYGLRQLAAELVFSNLSEALFGGTRAFTGKVRKCQFCGKPSKRLPWSAPFSFRALPLSSKRPFLS